MCEIYIYWANNFWSIINIHYYYFILYVFFFIWYDIFKIIINKIKLRKWQMKLKFNVMKIYYLLFYMFLFLCIKALRGKAMMIFDQNIKKLTEMPKIRSSLIGNQNQIHQYHICLRMSRNIMRSLCSCRVTVHSASSFA